MSIRSEGSVAGSMPTAKSSRENVSSPLMRTDVPVFAITANVTGYVLVTSRKATVASAVYVEPACCLTFATLTVAVAFLGAGLDARHVELERRGAALEVRGIEASLRDGEPIEVNDHGVGREVLGTGDRAVTREDLDAIGLGGGRRGSQAALRWVRGLLATGSGERRRDDDEETPSGG